eukprot:CAMPEP_0204821754 /NCGR_PEP_ID=MMETSP1018-20131115/131176_1 /ASSEMBLY_ACC=CAM_ASM_000518 /TAXON_ID=46462 /ORGANISM="Anophryoides haemophila, Strain AH6" /LENGTH=46 /DNA_ID= /DNA_START= /DNA_END= /DNA_ORIENTATION=
MKGASFKSNINTGTTKIEDGKKSITDAVNKMEDNTKDIDDEYMDYV